MKINAEIQINGALSGVQADDTLVFSKDIKSYDNILAELDDARVSPFSSLFMLSFPNEEKYLFAHWQPGYERFEQNGRYYCTRCLYEISASDMQKCGYDYSAVVASLPPIEHIKEHRYNIDPLVLDVVPKSIENDRAASSMVRYMLSALLNRKRILIRLGQSDRLKNDEMLKSSKLHSMLSAINAFHPAFRRYVSFAFSVKSDFLNDYSEPSFSKFWVLAFQDDDFMTSEAVVVDWKNEMPIVSNAEGILDDAEAKNVLNLLPMICKDLEIEGWEQLCDAVRSAKDRVDEAIRSCDVADLRRLRDAECAYRAVDIERGIFKGIAGAGIAGIEDIAFLASYDDGAAAEELLVKNVGNISSIDVLERLCLTFRLNPRIIDAVRKSFGKSRILNELKANSSVYPTLMDVFRQERKAQAEKLSVQERLSSFGDSFYGLEYADLSLKDLPDEDFMTLYRQIIDGAYRKVDRRQLPYASDLVSRFVSMSLSEDSIEDDAFIRLLKEEDLFKAELLDTLFKKDVVKTADEFIRWSKLFDRKHFVGAVAGFVDRKKDLTYSDLLVIMAELPNSYDYQEYVKANVLPLGKNFREVWENLSGRAIDDARQLLKDKTPANLKEWQDLNYVFPGAGIPFDMSFVKTGDNAEDDLVKMCEAYEACTSEIQKEELADLLRDALCKKTTEWYVKDIKQISTRFAASDPEYRAFLKETGAVAVGLDHDKKSIWNAIKATNYDLSRLSRKIGLGKGLLFNYRIAWGAAVLFFITSVVLAFLMFWPMNERVTDPEANAVETVAAIDSLDSAAIEEEPEDSILTETNDTTLN